MSKEEKPELNIKQLKFVDNVFEGMTQYEAYIKAGYEAADDSVARANASRLIANCSFGFSVSFQIVLITALTVVLANPLGPKHNSSTPINPCSNHCL